MAKQSAAEADTRLTHFRAAIRLPAARRAFDVISQGVTDDGAALSWDEAPSARYLDVASGQAVFSLGIVEGELLLTIHRTAGLARIAGGLHGLEAGLGAVSERADGDYELRIARSAQAQALVHLLLAKTTAAAGSRLRLRHWRLQLPSVPAPQVEGGYLWSAKKAPGRAARQLRVGLTGVAPGDIVFAGTADSITAIGIALDRVRSSPDPARTSSDGWLVPMRFQPLSEPLPGAVRAPPRARAPRAPQDLLELSDSEASAVRRAAAGQVEALEQSTAAETDGDLIEQAIEQQIWLRTDIEPLQKRRLSAARVGRGSFRDNVERLESACRVTGILDRRYLRVTHIKPWSDSNDAEKLDGANGLLLSPHIVHLFRRGHISFKDDGALLISRHLNPYVLKAWNLRQPAHPAGFRSEQRAYLAYHRERLFERVGGGRRVPAAQERA